MKKSVYTRPNKRMFVTVQRRTSRPIPKPTELEEPLVIDKASECHVTPPDVARRMVNCLGETGDYNTLEPSAGTGALVSALLASGYSPDALCAVERHDKLAELLKRLAVPVIHSCFLDYAAEVRGEVFFPRVVMNPPFSQARKHVEAALSLLGPTGKEEAAVLVALVPITFEHEDGVTLETLPEDTFATCRVRTKIVRFMRGAQQCLSE